jgi:acyl-CoA reductase-like NAD-dependent aldehyde dehydrogenase
MARQCSDVLFFNSKSAASAVPGMTLADQTSLPLLALLEKIREKQPILRHILSTYQTHEVTTYEIERSIRTLAKLVENTSIDSPQTIDSIVVFLPSNLPLYSLVLFALIPSIQSSCVYVRPNSILQEQHIITQLSECLNLDAIFPSVQIINQDHAGFLPYIRLASLVVFTGNPSNAKKILQDMKNDSVLVVNGSGHNPVVVTETADIDLAVEGSLLVKGFNGGQDCAGPDAILVHAAVAEEFITKFQQRFATLKTGHFNAPDTVIGPINRATELHKFAHIFQSNSKDIITGGIINYKDSIVTPTIIIRGIDRYPNYKEMYGPVAFIHPYKKDEDLAYYFKDPDGLYNANRMYVSLYGKSDYISGRNDAVTPGEPGNVGIVLHNVTIHDVEIGYEPYGGYGVGASCVVFKSSHGILQKAMPIYIPDLISRLLIAKDMSFLEKTPRSQPDVASVSMMRDKEIDPVILEFNRIATEIFAKNIAFGFVFGSAAKGKLKVKGSDRDDLDTFVCLKEEDLDAVKRYHQALIELHGRYGLKVDDAFPAEIMTVAKLQQIIDNLAEIDVSVDIIVEGELYDKLFWAHAITDKKTGFIGNPKLMSALIKQTLPHLLRWRNQILQQLEGKEEIPDHVVQRFVGLNKKEIIEKLTKFSPHLIVHLGLNYDEPSAAAKLP